VDTSVFELFARLVVALGIVLGIMLFGARVLKRRGFDLGGGKRGGNPRRYDVDILARRALTKGASVAVVRAGGKTLVLGVTEQHITLLAEPQRALDVATNELDSDLEIDLRDPRSDEDAHWTGLPIAVGAGRSGTPWMMALDRLRERTVRRD
jgi:flagellar protein FliO/FliZ